MQTWSGWIGWIIAVVVTVLLSALAAAPPLMPEPYRMLIMQAFHTVCHQIPERSPHWDGVQLAVCHRCFGIYLGLTAGTLSFPYTGRWDKSLMRLASYLLLGAVLIPGTDWLLNVLGVWTNTPASRFITGGIFGVTAGYFFARALANVRRRQASNPAVPAEIHVSN
jgi:uncharacterized membrane protein